MQPVSVNHYENFPVASWLCPPDLRAPIRAIYAFARTADDLADEGDAAPADRLDALAAYESDLHAVASGKPPSARWRAVFEPLTDAIRRHALPLALLTDLLSAFRQDVVKTGYADRAELLDYCRRSADPVGRLLLHLYGIGDAEALRRSDAICTALQLTNFWQDLSVDTARGRLYVPQSDCLRHGVPPEILRPGEDSPAVRQLVADLVAWARTLMQHGAPLVHQVRGRAGWELRLVVQGSLCILRKIEQSGHDALRHRPVLALQDVAGMAWHALAMRAPASLGRQEAA